MASPKGTRVLNIPLTVGRKDSIDPKYAPLGVLATCQNLRVQKDGRLVSRTAYRLQGNTTQSGTLVAHDLHEFQGRLVALGSDQGDGFPVDTYEMLAAPTANDWRGSSSAQDCTLNPFTNPREVAGVNQVAAGVGNVDVACGAGLVCMVWRNIVSNELGFMIARQADGQVMHESVLVTNASSACVTFAVDSFYVAISLTTGDVVVYRYFGSPTVAASPTLIATPITGAPVGFIDINAVTNGSGSRFMVIVGKSVNTTVYKYNATGTQQGSTITFASVSTQVWVEGDEVHNTLNTLTFVGAVPSLRTFNFSTGALTVGPTVVDAGSTGSFCRIPALGVVAEGLAIAINRSAGDVFYRHLTLTAHAATTSVVFASMRCRGRLLTASSGTNRRAVAFPAMVAPTLPTLTDPVTGQINASNAIVYATQSPNFSVHMVTRDRENASLNFIGTGDLDHFNLQLDASTGRVAL